MVRKNKTTQGRKKIAIEKIASEEARHVCFSKCRNRIFTKATDLATLCGAEVAIMVKSLVGNPYSFGSPGVNEVVDHFLAGEAGSRSSSLIAENRMNLVRELNHQCMELSRQTDHVNAKKSLLQVRRNTLVQDSPICQFVDDVEDLVLIDLAKVKVTGWA